MTPGIDSLAHDECGDGRAKARGLYADVCYRMGLCYLDLGQKDKAIDRMERHLLGRGLGCRSIYLIADARKKVRVLQAQQDAAKDDHQRASARGIAAVYVSSKN